MTAAPDLREERARIYERLDDLKTRKYLANMIDSTQRMIEEQNEIDGQIKALKDRLDEIGKELGDRE